MTGLPTSHPVVFADPLPRVTRVPCSDHHASSVRVGAIRQLRWADIDFEGREVRWRAEHEKTGYGHVTPLTDEAVAALKEARRMSEVSGNAPVLNSPRDAKRCMDRAAAHKWWKQAEALAGLEPKRGRGWHSLRRKFASDLGGNPAQGIPKSIGCK